MLTGMVIGGIVGLIGLFLWAVNDACPNSRDGEHHWAKERFPGGFRLRCVSCWAKSRGIDAFARK
jgi:hypothetical protein